MEEKPYRAYFDPGHGGSDPGAVNWRLGIMEKDITLAVSRFIWNLHHTDDYLFLHMFTRTEDEYRSLDDRCGKANLYAADAFVSIHCNARHREGAHGLELEVFHYETSKPGEEFAKIMLGGLLCDLSGKITVISRGVKVGRRKDKNGNWKPFYVVKHTIMPAILVELGFLTDDEEAEFLNKEENQRIMAKSICEATELFLEGGSLDKVIKEIE